MAPTANACGWQEPAWSPDLIDGQEQLKGQHQQPESSSTNDGLGWGVLLIIIGCALLFGRFTGLVLRNWWAWFIIVPAGFKLYRGLQLIETRGRFTSTAASMFSGSFFLLTVGLFFLLGLNWTLFWPLLLICLGLNGIMWAFVKK